MTAAPHYFAFSRDFDPTTGKRRCGECRHIYDRGEHIEVTVLKPYTKYVCSVGGGLGHSSHWTGAYLPENRRLSDGSCMCGADLVEEDGETWQLSWEMCTPLAPEWHRTTVVRSRHAAEQQRDGLLELIDQGEPIRDVRLIQLVEVPR